MSSNESSIPNQVGEYFLHLARNPKNIGYLKNPSGRGKAIGQCGDSIEVSLHVSDGAIADIRVAPSGCIYTLVCASAMSELVKGKDLDEALYLEPDEIAAVLGGMPDDHMHCARLAINTLGEAIDDYYKRPVKPE